jgi:cardiolipin synthase
MIHANFLFLRNLQRATPSSAKWWAMKTLSTSTTRATWTSNRLFPRVFGIWNENFSTNRSIKDRKPTQISSFRCLSNDAKLKTQELGTAKKVSTYEQLLREASTIPNILTMTRLVSTPGLAYLIWIDEFKLAIVFCFFSGILDWFDGYLARAWNQHTVLGSFLDPLADKLFVGTLLGTLTIKGLFPTPLAVLVIGRDVVLLSGAFIYRYFTKPPDADFFATTGQGVIEAKPTTISKVNTVLQMSVMGFALTKAAYGVPSPIVFDGMCWLVGGTTLLSGLAYADLSALKTKAGSDK